MKAHKEWSSAKKAKSVAVGQVVAEVGGDA